MATVSFSVPGVRVTRSVVDSLVDAMRPYVRATLQDRLDEVLRRGRERYDGFHDFDTDVQLLQDQLEDGGRVVIEAKALVDRDGVRHEPDGYGGNGRELMLLIGEVESGSITMYAHAEKELFTIDVHFNEASCSVSISAPSARILPLRRDVEAILKASVDPERIEAFAPPFKVFIGHGGDPQWKYLRRALEETYGFMVEAFESSERAGFHTLVVVNQMIHTSTVAVVVMTGEDQAADGTWRARENVVHEVGFCQGALGIDRTIILMEEGISEPTNITGLTQIRFKRGALIDVEQKVVDALGQRRKAHDFQVGGPNPG